jgi:hypothetical protein
MSLCNPFYVTPYISKKIAAKPPLLSNRQMNTDWYVYDAVNYHITTGLSSTTLCRQSQQFSSQISYFNKHQNCVAIGKNVIPYPPLAEVSLSDGGG